MEPINTEHTPRPILRGTGPKDARILLLGAAPGDEEMRAREPFAGASGRLFTDLLHRAGILRSLCYSTYVVKEQPLGGILTPYISIEGTKGVVEGERFPSFIAALKEEIQRIQPNVVVAVGAVPLWALCGKRGIGKWRGSVLESTLIPGLKVIPILDPAEANRQYLFRHFISFDLHKVAREAETAALPAAEQTYIIRPTFDAAASFLRTILSTVKRVAFDIEVSSGQVSCISFAPSANRVISIPFVKGGQDYFTIPQEREIWRLIAEILESTSIEKIGQNVMFDASFLLKRYGIHAKCLHDTMIAQAILYPDFPKGLDFITSIYTDIPYYKDEGKSVIRDQMKGILPSGDAASRDEQFWLYNAKDSIVLMEAFPKQCAQLISSGNMETYQAQIDLIPPLLFMGERGIRMDTEGMKSASTSSTSRAAEIEAEVTTLARAITKNPAFTINLRSPKQLMDYFYVTKRARAYTDKGRVTINEKALKRLSRAGHKEASLILEHRRIAKMQGTYFDMVLDEDGRLRSSMNPVGARTGRLSSSKTIFGTGANIQNQPPVMKGFMLPDDGYVLYNVDLSQAENRIVAYLGPDITMIDAFEEGVDIHSKTASLIFGESPEDIARWDKTGERMAELAGGKYSHRGWGKRANHGLNYGLGYKAFALHLEVDEATARFIWEAYHKAYPGVRKFHHMIQEQLREDRTVTNLFNRKYRFADRWDDSLFLEAYAFIPQSTVADCINRRGMSFLYNRQDLFAEAEILAQVHDSIVFQIPRAVSLERHASILLALRESLSQPLSWRGRTFHIPADVSVHTANWKDKVLEVKGSRLFQSARDLADTLDNALTTHNPIH